MKIIYVMSIIALMSITLIAQNRQQIPKSLQNISLKKPIRTFNDAVSQNQSIVTLNQSKVILAEEVGQTIYDLQSNSSVDNRIYMYSDGTIGTTYTIGTGTYADRGTGYNYFDGSAWTIPVPTVRIENIKTGWPSYSHLGTGNEGEIVICHQFGTGLIMLKRAAKGTGTWSQSVIPKITGTSPSWPRICTSGNTIHVLSAESDTGHLYLGQKNSVFYSRSTDGGATWDIQYQLIPGMEAVDYPTGFGGDVYSWAEPQGNTIAFVIGDNWTDLILMKSIDGGTTWTKTKVFQHPYPNWNDNILTPDTPYVADGAHAVTLDASGNAHVVFGIMRVLNDIAGDNQTSYFPAVDGIGYWKEGDATLTDINPDVLYSNDKLLAWVQDLTGNMFAGYTGGDNWPLYYLSLSSTPQLTIDGDNFYLIYKSVVENMQSSAGQFYSHIWGRKSIDGGLTWCDIVEITTGNDYDMAECVFPSLSKTTTNNMLHIAFQEDFEPGLSVRGDLDPVGVNSIMYLTLDATSDMGLCTNNVTSINLSGEVSIFPNPVADILKVDFSFNKMSNVEMTITDILGNTVYNEKFVAGRGASKQIHVGSLPSGIYMAKFETEKGTFTKKIIKQ